MRGEQGSVNFHSFRTLLLVYSGFFRKYRSLVRSRDPFRKAASVKNAIHETNNGERSCTDVDF